MREVRTLGALTRRKALVLGGAAVSSPWIWSKAEAQARRLVVRDSGGPFTKAYEEAFYRPFREATGIEVVGVASTHEPTAQIKSMVDSKTYTWNIASITIAAIEQLVGEGEYLERHELEKDPVVAQIPPEYLSPHGVGCDVYSTVIGYRKDKFKDGKGPDSWADFWNTSAFPGRRALRKHPFDTIEGALFADGVPSDKVYPADFDRAFKSLDRIKPAISAWWTGGAQATQMLVSGEVDMVPVWVTRVQAAADAGAPVGIGWNQNLWGCDSWAILKGTPHLEACRDFIKFCSDPKRLAVITNYAAVGPVTPKSYEFIDPKKAPNLPTFPENRARGVKIDNSFWAQNKDKAIERFNTWTLT